MMVIRYATRPDAGDENERLVKQVFAQLAADSPSGLHYMVLRLAEGGGFVHVVILDGDENPLTELSSFAEFQRGIDSRCAESPVLTAATVVGAYQFSPT